MESVGFPRTKQKLQNAWTDRVGPWRPWPGAGRPADSTTNGALQCSEDSPNLEEHDSDGVPNVGQLEGGLREAAGRGQIYHCLK